MLLYNYITRAKRAKSNPKPAYYNREADSLVPRLSLLRAKTAYDLLPPRRYIWAREGGHRLTPELRSGHRLVDTVAVYISLCHSYVISATSSPQRLLFAGYAYNAGCYIICIRSRDYITSALSAEPIESWRPHYTHALSKLAIVTKNAPNFSFAEHISERCLLL